MENLFYRLKKAGKISRKTHGKRLEAYLPGMFSYNGLSGKYPALSITGNRCELECDHCMGSTLEDMIDSRSPEILLEKTLRLSEKGVQGILISGGCDSRGRLPWKEFIPVIKEIKNRTGLYVSIHCGLVDDVVSEALKDAGIDQALIDVIGDDETYQKIYHVNFGISEIISSMKSIERAKIPLVPHIVCGLDGGRMKSEMRALEIISCFNIEQLVVVSLMPIPGTPLWGRETPNAEEIANIIAEARFRMPNVRMSLGCARKRGDVRLEIMAVQAGINRIALPSEEVLEYAKQLGMDIRFQRTCCSVSRDFSGEEW